MVKRVVLAASSKAGNFFGHEKRENFRGCGGVSIALIRAREIKVEALVIFAPFCGKKFRGLDLRSRSS